MPSLIAMIEITASIAPAAPRQCPVCPFVELTSGTFEPKISFRAAVSFLSFAGVDVP